MHGTMSQRNRLTSQFHHPRRKVNTQQIQLEPLRHEAERHIAWATGGVQYPSATWPEQRTELPVRLVVQGQVHEFVPIQVRVLVKHTG